MPNLTINDLTLNAAPAVTAEIETQVTGGGDSQRTTLDAAVKSVLPSPGAIGGTAPDAGNFTSLDASAALTGATIDGIIGSVTPATGDFTDLDASGALTGLTIDGPLGSVTPAVIAGTTVTASGIVSVDDVTDTSSAVTGSIHTDGGLGVAKKLFVGTTTTLTGDVVGPSGTWDSGGLDIATGDTYAINGTDVLDATTLGATVVASSLTSVGTIASLVATTADINAGTVDAVIGGTTPAAGSFTTASATSTLGYATGAGGVVTQITSKATGVTLNKASGQITLHNASLAAATTVSFALTNSVIAATDVVFVSVGSVGTVGAYTLTTSATAAGSCTISLRNETGGALGEAIVLNFAVIKAVAA